MQYALILYKYYFNFILLVVIIDSIMKSMIVLIALLFIHLALVESDIESFKKILKKSFDRFNQNDLRGQKNNSFFSLRENKKKAGWSLFNNGYGSLGQF